MNPDYKDIDTVPINVLLRDQIGRNLGLDEFEKISVTIDELFDLREDFEKKIEDLAQTWIYNLDNSASVGGSYLRDAVKRKIAIKTSVKDRS